MIRYQGVRAGRRRVWNPDAVHLLPADRSDHRVIDAERICQAIAALDRPEVIAARARQFAVLADPTRLTLLTAIKAAGPISVSDLAAATGINDATVSQTLRYLRASQTVIAERDGRVVRYRLASTPVTDLLAAPQVPAR
jgi:ArsR family transcriptional regulator, lead/cadmium/zinc/bismuth-responsive transcriptional repressor